MKKKLLILSLIVLIILFLIFFFSDKKREISSKVNNTINNTNEYKITLTLKNIYYMNNKEMNSKIVYTEIKKDNLYKIINKAYENNSLRKKNISYVENNEYYYKENNEYKNKTIEDISEIKDFQINYYDFFSKIKRMTFIKEKDGKEYYKTRIKSTDAFSLIYDNSKNYDIQKYTNIFIITNEREIEEIYFSVKDKNSNKYFVDLKLDFGLQDIKLDIN